MGALEDKYGVKSTSGESGVEIDPNGGYWINTTKGRQHFPGSPPAATKPLDVPVPKPVGDFLSKASNTLAVPFITAPGAVAMDLMRRPYLGVGMGPSGKNMVDELKHLKFGDAYQHYALTSLEANRQRAALGDKGAQFLDKHPGMAFAPLAAVESFLDPANKVFGALGKVGRAAGIKPLDPLNRMSDMYKAAREAPAQRAAAAQAAAQRAARAQAAREGAAQGNAERRAAEHFAEKQSSSLKNTGLREGPPQTPPTLSGPHRPALNNPGASFKPAAPPQPSSGYVPPALGPGRGVLPQGNVPPAPPALAGEARLALPPGGTADARLQEQLRATLKSVKKNARPQKIAKPIAAGPLTPPPTIGGRPALPPAAEIPGSPRAAGEGFEMNEPPHPTGQPALTGANPVPEFEGLIPPNRLPPGETPTAIGKDTRESMTTPSSQLVNKYSGGSGVTPVGEVHPNGPTPEMDPQEVGRQADLEFRKMSEQQTPKAFAAKASNDLYKGLTLAEQQRLFHGIEAGAVPQEYADRYGRYTQTQRILSKWLLDNGLADESQLWNEATFHPRSGALLNPDYDVEEQPGTAAGARGIRKGTLNTRRTYRTLQQAIQAGEQMNPEWSPMEALENHLTQRMTAIQLESGMRKLKDLGLIVGAEHPRPQTWDRLSDEPDVARFGSPTIAGGASFHPAIAKGIRDITASSMNPDKYLSSPLHKAVTPLTMANRAAMRFQVAQPLYHLPVNVVPNQLATIVSHSGWRSFAALPEYIKEWMTGGKALGEMHEKGVYHPFASEIPAHKLGRPMSDLSPAEKLERTWNLTGKGVEKVSSEPLYGWAEPRAAKAMFRAMKKAGKSDAEAALITRQTVGEHENVGAMERDMAQMMKFPAWRKSVLRLWPSLLARSPALYNAPHRAAAAYNLAHGLGPQPGDSDQLLPGLYAGSDAQGNPRTINFPSPANIPLELMELMGSPLAGDTDQDVSRGLRLGLSVVNPLLNTGMRTAMTEVGSGGQPNTGMAGYRIYDKDAPQNQTILGKALSAVTGTAERNAPLRNEGTGPLSAIGLGFKPVPNEDARLSAALVESRYRKLVTRLRYAARDAKKAGDDADAQSLSQQADELYAEMDQAVQDAQQPATPPAGATGGQTLEQKYGSP